MTRDAPEGSWAWRFQRGLRWQRYWDHPSRWTRRGWLSFWSGVGLRVLLATIMFAMALTLSGSAAVVLFTIGAYHGLSAVFGVAAAIIELRRLPAGTETGVGE